MLALLAPGQRFARARTVVDLAVFREVATEQFARLRAHKYQPGRLKNKERINGRLNEIFSTNTQQYWLERLQAARIPCAPVNNLQQALHDEQVLFRNMIVDVAHPLGGSTRMPGNPVKLSDTHEDTYSPPPLLGQHNEEVYTGLLGLSPEEMATLKGNGVI